MKVFYIISSIAILLTSSFVNADQWLDYVNDPYSEDALCGYFELYDENPTKDFNIWHINRIYYAKRLDKSTLIVSEIMKGKRSERAKAGCIIVFDSDGSILKVFMNEMINPSLLTQNFDVINHFHDSMKLKDNCEIITLPDMNGDGNAELPTCREIKLSTEERIKTASIYLTKTNDIPRVVTFEFYDRVYGEKTNWPINTIMGGKLFLQYKKNNPKSLSVMCHPLKLLEKDVTQFTVWMFEEKEPIELVTYTWNSQTKSYEGPSEGPNGLWVVK